MGAPDTGMVAILGRNGAGKTTLLKTIVGELEAGSGAVLIDGRNVTRMPTERRIALGLGYVPQEQAVFSRLTVRENLAVGALARSGRVAIDQVLQIFPKLGQRLGQTAGTLSGGERKMLAISRALLGNPKLLLLDESTEGVWIGVIEEIAERLQRLAEQITIVLVEQHLDLALRLAQYAYVLERGRVVVEGSSKDVRENPNLLRYLAP
jgi:branched-chain amino acid transport system ATP-binding protein